MRKPGKWVAVAWLVLLAFAGFATVTHGGTTLGGKAFTLLVQAAFALLAIPALVSDGR